MVEYSNFCLKSSGYYPYYMYRQKNMAGNFENVGYAVPGLECIYNILIMEEVQSILALTLAKAAAIVPGQVLTNEEMTGLVDGLFAVATPNYTPDGKTVLSVINEDDLEKLFK